MQPTDEQLIDRACRAYFRRFGKHADFPGQDSTVSKRGVVRLTNVRGELARYKYDAKRDRLKFVA
jgi:hypothetical protein